MIMGNYLIIAPVQTDEMKRRVPIGIDHVTVVPENVDAGSERDRSEESTPVGRSLET